MPTVALREANKRKLKKKTQKQAGEKVHPRRDFFCNVYDEASMELGDGARTAKEVTLLDVDSPQ